MTHPGQGLPDRAARRRFLKFSAAGFAAVALPDLARAQLATQPPPKHAAIDELKTAGAAILHLHARDPANGRPSPR